MIYNVHFNFLDIRTLLARGFRTVWIFIIHRENRTAGFIVSLRVPLDRFMAHNARPAVRIEFLIIRSTSH